MLAMNQNKTQRNELLAFEENCSILSVDRQNACLNVQKCLFLDYKITDETKKEIPMKKMNDGKNRGNTKIIIVNAVAYLFATVAIVLDIVFKLNKDSLLSFASIMYPTVVTVAGFFITIYILFLEIYRDRYPLENMHIKLFPNRKYLLCAIIYHVIVGSIVLCIGSGMISFVLFCATSLAFIVSILIFIFKSNKSLMLTTYIEDFCEEIQKEFEVHRCTISSLTFGKVKNVLDECVTREEYHTVGVIIEKTGELFREFLKNSISISAKGKNSNKAVADTFEQFMILNAFELELCKSIKSSQLTQKILVQQRKNLCFCIENYQMEWYEKYFNEYLKYLYSIQSNNFTDLTRLIYGIFPAVVQCLYEKNKVDCACEVINKVHTLNTAVVCVNKRANSKIYVNFLAAAVKYAIDKGNEKMLDLLMALSGEHVYTLIRHSDSVNEILEYYTLIFDLVLNYNIEKALDLYERCVKAFSYNPVQPSDLIEFNMFCLSMLMEKASKTNAYQERLMEWHINLLYQVGKAKDKYAGYLFFPDFKSLIMSNQGNAAEIKKVTARIKKILNHCVLGDNISLFYEIVQKINEILAETKMQQKFVQEELIAIYFWMIDRTRLLVNKQFLELSLFNLNTVIEELDKNKAISEAFGEHIINQLHTLCKENMHKNTSSSLDIINMLSQFVLSDNPFYFVSVKTETQKMLYKTLFNIGTDCVENGFEEGVRSVSNALGWMIIKSIEQGVDKHTKYLIDRAAELYAIATSMDISHKTRMFMLTLFPTVGAYCCKNIAHAKYCDMIIRAIRNEELKNVETAVRLRTSENDMWNDLYGGRTDELTKQFMIKFKKAISNS